MNRQVEPHIIYDIAVIGAGPAGLACGLEAKRLQLNAIIIDKGTVVNSIVGFPTYMTFFSTADRLELGDMPFTSPNFRPTRQEVLEYYRGVARKGNLNLSLNNTVLNVNSTDDDSAPLFSVQTEKGTIQARYVVLATGYFDYTNRLEVPGEELPKVRHFYREPFEHYRQNVLVIGGRNSAVETALDLFRHGANVTMIHRGEEFGKRLKYWIRPDIENRIANGEIRMMWETEVKEITEDAVTLYTKRTGEEEVLPNDIIYAMIGYRPDASLMASCGIQYDPETLIPRYNPEPYETNVPNFFLAGSVACGCKTWEIFIENGREHAVTVVREIAERIKQRGTNHGIAE